MDNNSERYLRLGKYYGEVLKAKDYHGCLLSEATYEADQCLPRHAHESAFFCLLLDGAYREYYLYKSVWYEPFTVAFHPPGETHRVEIGSTGARVLAIEIPTLLLERLQEYAGVPDTLADLYGGELVCLAIRVLRNHRARTAFSPFAIEGLVLQMLGAVARSPRIEETRPPVWLSRVLELLHEGFRHNLSVNYIAAEVGVHPIHLARVFRKFYQQTICDYIHGLRVQFACRQISHSELPLAEIALSAGFYDQSHFTRMFKRLLGCTPGDFRTRATSSGCQD
jgi:AraC family transcriptional regulator